MLLFWYVGGQNLLNSRVGNYNYSCPEIVIGTGYDHTVDWWAVAIMTFHFMAGITPFEANSQEETLENIIMYRANWDLLPEVTSNECKDFISKIISVKKAEERLGYEEGSMQSLHGSSVLTHDFFADIDWYTLFEGYGPLYPDLSMWLNTNQPSRRASGIASPRTMTNANSIDSPVVNSAMNDSQQLQTPGGASTADMSQMPLFTLLTEQEMLDLPDYVAMNKLHTEEQKEQQSSSQSSHHHVQNNQLYRKSHHHANARKRADGGRKTRVNVGASTGGGGGGGTGNRQRGNSSSSGTPNDSEDDDHFNHMKHLHDGFEEFTFNS